MSAGYLEWVKHGSGRTPRVTWTLSAEAPLHSLSYARESGETFAADEIGSIYRIDADGKLAGVMHGKPIRALAFCDVGHIGAALVGQKRLQWFARNLSQESAVELPGNTRAVAIDAHGHYTAVSTVSGQVRIYETGGRLVREFDVFQPLVKLEFVVQDSVLVGLGEYSLLAAYGFNGGKIFEEKLWSNVGDVTVTGDGRKIILACFSLGAQCHDDSGSQLGTYQVGGTVARVATSFSGSRLAAATVERHIVWLAEDGQMLWDAETPDDISHLIVDPLGTGLICGLKSGRIIRLDW